MSHSAFNTQKVLDFCTDKLVELKQKAIADRDKWIKEHIEYKKKHKAKWYGFLITVPTEAEMITEYRWQLWLPWNHIRLTEIFALCTTCDCEETYIDKEDAVCLKKFGLEDGRQSADAMSRINLRREINDAKQK